MEKILCDRCNGKGYYVYKEGWNHICPKCLGRKELDWLQNIIGVKSSDFYLYPDVYKALMGIDDEKDNRLYGKGLFKV